MKIVLSGIETNNKGAELMLYAILQEIERVYPKAIIYLPYDSIKQGLGYIQTNLDIRNKPYSWTWRFHLAGLLKRLKLPYVKFTDVQTLPNVDYFIDASGFCFSDQWHPTQPSVDYWERQLKGYYEQGTKIIFLPQAFGPIKENYTKEEIKILNKYASVIMPRDTISLNYLLNAGVDTNKIHLYPDFTCLVKGVFPAKYSNLQGGVCIIPNMRMIDKNVITLEKYLDVLFKIIKCAHQKHLPVYLLNHEGKRDYNLALICKKKSLYNVEVVNELNALEIKGLISTSKLCISSRFHGLVSALNTHTPCLATSWSHKYQELFNDYKLTDCILNVNKENDIIEKINSFLDENNNKEIRNKLETEQQIIQNKVMSMWSFVWSIK